MRAGDSLPARTRLAMTGTPSSQSPMDAYGLAVLDLSDRKRRTRTMRVPLMGVRKDLQNSRLAIRQYNF